MSDDLNLHYSVRNLLEKLGWIRHLGEIRDNPDKFDLFVWDVCSDYCGPSLKRYCLFNDRFKKVSGGNLQL